MAILDILCVCVFMMRARVCVCVCVCVCVSVYLCLFMHVLSMLIECAFLLDRVCLLVCLLVCYVSLLVCCQLVCCWCFLVFWYVRMFVNWNVCPCCFFDPSKQHVMDNYIWCHPETQTVSLTVFLTISFSNKLCIQVLNSCHGTI